MAKKVDKNEQPSALNQEPVDAPERFLDADGNPTADEFSEKPDAVSGKMIRTRNRMRPESTHGTIASNPSAQLDSFSIRRENAGPREIRSNQMSQVGEDPGRVFDSAGLHPQAAAQHERTIPRDPVADAATKARLQGQVPDRPLDTPGNTAAVQASSEQGLTATGADNQPNPVVPAGSVPESSAPAPERTPILNPQPGVGKEPTIS